MKIVAFIGASGTGKSHRATWVAYERNIEYIIDDGLLIHGNSVVSGISAKKEKTKIASIRRALFNESEHAEMVKRAIATCNPEAILILGTSEDMVETIRTNLGLPPIAEKVYIQDIATEEEINRALTVRKSQGKHVIPVPTFEIKKDFSGYFLDPLQIFRKRGKGSFQLVGEKSVVRPSFSYRGKYTISDYTIYQIAEHIALSFENVNRVSRFRAENHPDGIYIDMDLVLVFGCDIKSLLRDVRNKIINEVEKLTSINIKNLNITAKSLVMHDQRPD